MGLPDSIAACCPPLRLPYTLVTLVPVSEVKLSHHPREQAVCRFVASEGIPRTSRGQIRTGLGAIAGFGQRKRHICATTYCNPQIAPDTKWRRRSSW
ncbi:hypothetical protein MRX96_013182 [Rhipicephalus microplus]